MNIWPLLDAVSFNDMDYDENEDILPSLVNFSGVLKEVSHYVREKIPGWFDEHIRVFREQTDGMFSMEYTEEEFAERLYAAIGFVITGWKWTGSPFNLSDIRLYIPA